MIVVVVVVVGKRGNKEKNKSTPRERKNELASGESSRQLAWNYPMSRVRNGGVALSLRAASRHQAQVLHAARHDKKDMESQHRQDKHATR